MGIEFLSFLKGKKKRQPNVGSALQTLEPETVPEYTPGLQEDGKTIVRLVSNKKVKKPYRVSGIDDVASKNNWKAWLYLAPVIILVVIFLLYPLINTIFISFTRNYQQASGKYDGFTIDNFLIIFKLKDYVTASGKTASENYFLPVAVPNTFILTFITVPVSIALALIISVALNSIKAFQKFLQTVFFLPYVTNSIAIGMVFSVLFADQGLINFIFHLQKINNGNPMQWINNAPTHIAMIPLCLFIVWNSIPF